MLQVQVIASPGSRGIPKPSEDSQLSIGHKQIIGCIPNDLTRKIPIPTHTHWMRVSPLILPSKNPPKFTDVHGRPSAPAVLAAPAPTLKIGWNVWSDCLTFWGIKHDKKPSTTINYKTYKIPIKSLWPNQVDVESTSQLGGAYFSENTEAWPCFLHGAATWGMCYKPVKPSTPCFKSYPTEEKCQIDKC